MLKRFAKDYRGSAQMWVAFCILVFFMLAAVLCNAHTIYSKYYAVEDELTRCASITLDSNIHNAKLRDVITDVQYQPVMNVLEQNLVNRGWTREANGGPRLNLRFNFAKGKVAFGRSMKTDAGLSG